MNTLQPRSFTTPGMSMAVLAGQNRRFRGTGGVSRENRSLGFSPAFRDSCTGGVYLSRFANGTIAPVHLLDRLPDELVLSRNASGRVLKARCSVVAGFVREGRFYTREEASRAIAELEASGP